MAGKRLGRRIVIPNDDELDRPVEDIRKGSTFIAKNKEVRSNIDVEPKASGTYVDNGKEGGAGDQSLQVRDVDSKFSGLSGENKETEKGSSSSGNVTSTEADKNAVQNEAAVKEDSIIQQVASKFGTASIIVSSRQRGNPVLKYIRNVPWEYGDAVPDYILGQTTCALFLSLRYHNFNPDYIHERLRELGNRFVLRILLVLVDVKNPHASLKELAKICILSDCTLILSWSNEEAGRYLETYKSYENKPADVLQEKVDGDHHSKMIDCLTSVKSVNKTDAVTLMANFGSLRGIVNASKEEISLCPGFGPQKAERLHKIFHEPFIKTKNRREKALRTSEKPDSDEQHISSETNSAKEQLNFEEEMVAS